MIVGGGPPDSGAHLVETTGLADGYEPPRTDLDAPLPRGLCGNREEHEPHVHRSRTLGVFWCTARQKDRLPGAWEYARRERERGEATRQEG